MIQTRLMYPAKIVKFRFIVRRHLRSIVNFKEKHFQFRKFDKILQEHTVYPCNLHNFSDIERILHLTQVEHELVLARTRSQFVAFGFLHTQSFHSYKRVTCISVREHVLLYDFCQRIRLVGVILLIKWMRLDLNGRTGISTYLLLPVTINRSRRQL